MGLIVDGIILLIFGGCIFNGYKKGLAKSLLKLLTSVLAIIIAIILYKPFETFVIENTLIDDNIQYSIERVINNSSDDENKKTEVNKDNNMPAPIVDYLNTNLKETVETKKEQAVTEVAKNASKLIVTLGCIIIIYIIAKILLKIITVLFDIFSKLPVIKQCNELGGIIYGIIEAFAIVIIILALVSVITPLVGNNIIVDMIEQSFIGKFLYDTNILINIIF